MRPFGKFGPGSLHKLLGQSCQSSDGMVGGIVWVGKLKICYSLLLACHTGCISGQVCNRGPTTKLTGCEDKGLSEPCVACYII